MGRGVREEEEQEGSGRVGEEEEQEGGGGVGEEEEEGSRVERWKRRRVLYGWESKRVGARKRIVGKGMGEKIVLR